MNVDQQFVRKVIAGDSIATREFVARVEPVVRRVVSRYAGESSRFDDWTQEVFVRLIERIDRFDGRAPLEHWAAKVALHVCIDQLRSQRRERLTLPTVAEVRQAMLAHNRDAESNDMKSATAKQVVTKLLDHLSPEDRAVIQLLDLEGRTVAEVAALLNRSPSWVKVRAHRARHWLEETCRHLIEDKHV